jgi:hypothetical protein
MVRPRRSIIELLIARRWLVLVTTSLELAGCARLVSTSDGASVDARHDFALRREASRAEASADAARDAGLLDARLLDGPQPELPRKDLRTPDLPEPDLPRKDLAKADLPKPDLPKPDLPKPDQAKPDLPKPDQAKPDQPKPDLPKPDLPKPAFVDNPNHPLTIVGSAAALPVEAQRTIFASRTSASYGALAFAASGVLYALNHSTGAVDQISTSGTVSTFATGVGAAYWSRIAVDAGGILHVSTTATLKKITTTGVVSTWTLPATFSYLTGVAFDAKGDLRAADINTGIVHRITPGGTVSTFATGFPFAQLYALHYNLAGDLFVNVGNTSVQRVTPSGTISTFVTTAGRQNYEHGAFDGQGNLYLPLREYNGTSGWNGKGVIVRYSPAGVETQFVPSQGTFAVNPGGLAFDAQGRLYASVGSEIIRFAP